VKGLLKKARVILGKGIYEPCAQELLGLGRIIWFGRNWEFGF